VERHWSKRLREEQGRPTIQSSALFSLVAADCYYKVLLIQVNFDNFEIGTSLQNEKMWHEVFAVSGPTLWNSLPLTVLDQSLTQSQFCALLKTVLFCRAYETLPYICDSLQAVKTAVQTDLLLYFLTR